MPKKETIHKRYTFGDFANAVEFVNQVAKRAEAANHHPKIQIDWNTVDVWFSTHESGDTVTEKDRQLANEVDEVYRSNQKPSDSLPSEVKLYGDGGSRGNPGPAASGFVLTDMNDTVLVSDGEYMGITTNNQAEYHSLEMGLVRALEEGVKKIHVFMDSQLVVNQIMGTYKVRSQELLPRYQSVKQLMSQFQKSSITHVPRALNKLADAEVNRVLDSV